MVAAAPRRVEIDNIPDALRDRAQWVCWRHDANAESQPTKVPYISGTSHRASTTDCDSWGTFDEAIAALEDDHGWDGIGYVFSEDDGFVGIDLDECLTDDGELMPEARRIVDQLQSYAEISPSGCGVKIWVKGSLPISESGRRTRAIGFKQIEIYQHGRYFTVTGRHLRGTPRTIEEKNGELQVLWDAYFEPRDEGIDPSRQTSREDCPPLADDEVMQRARGAQNGAKFTALYDSGDCSAYDGDESAADLALCDILAYRCGGDRAQIDRLFRGSALMRDKWDERRGETTYGAMTVDKALQATSAGAAGSWTGGEAAADGSSSTVTQPLPLTDTGNAERFARYHGARARYCDERGSWFLWQGRFWLADDTLEVVRLAKQAARGIYSEAAGCEDTDRRRKVADHALRSESRRAIKAMIDLARSEPPIPVRMSSFDTDPWLLNVENGTVDLRTGELKAHDPGDLITKVAPLVYGPEASCPTWLAFLDRIMGGNQGLIQYLQRLAGYFLTGDIREQILPVYWGEGSNGKSTLVDTLTGIMGDYATTAPDSLLTVNRFNEHATEIADLCGRRLVVASETEEGRQLRVQLVKKMTGDARLKGRFMRADFFEFDRTHKTLLITNNKPVIHEQKNAIWRRIRLVPFTVTIPPKEQDPGLMERLREEWSGILRWAVEGCLAWQRDGLKAPPEVEQATEEYKDEQDRTAEFLGDCFTLTGNNESFASRETVRTVYVEWCRRTGERDPLDHHGLYERLRDHEEIKEGWGQERGKRTRGFRGLAIVPGWGPRVGAQQV